MRRWFEVGELPDTSFSSSTGDKLFLQLPQKAEFIAWANSMVGKFCTVFNDQGDSGLCNGGGAPTHLFSAVAPCQVIQQYQSVKSLAFDGFTPDFNPLIRPYTEKPGPNDGPNESNTQGAHSKGKPGGGGTLKISLLSYLLLLLQTWQGVVGSNGQIIAGTGNVPKRWLDWLTLLISHYGRYSPTQIYGFLARVDFAGPTFKV